MIELIPICIDYPEFPGLGTGELKIRQQQARRK